MTQHHDRRDPEGVHDWDDPLGHLNALEASRLGVSPGLCVHCEARPLALLPMPGNGWAVDFEHDQDCPEHVDNQHPARPATGPETGPPSEQW